ncbi:MAG: hypothetical protein AAF633_22085, partial [Chloroflexota bacterium]
MTRAIVTVMVMLGVIYGTSIPTKTTYANSAHGAGPAVSPSQEGEEPTDGEQPPAEGEADPLPIISTDEEDPAQSPEPEAVEGEPADEAPAEEQSEPQPEPEEAAPAADDGEAPPESEETPPAVEDEAAPVSTKSGEPLFDPATIVLEKITLAPEPIAFVPADNLSEAASFDSLIWQQADAGGQLIGIRYSDKYPTEGEQALEIAAPLTPIPGGQSAAVNSYSWQKPVLSAVPWASASFITVDAYLEERIAKMPRLDLLLIIGDAGSIVVEPVNVDRLKQWDNRHITYDLSEIEEGVLGGLTAVGFRLSDYNDGAYGEPLSGIHLHIDNLRLNGGTLWDRFEWTGFERFNPGENITEIGLNNGGFEETQGALFFAWQIIGQGNVATASVSTTSPQDWSGHTFIRSQVLSPDGVAPISLTLFDGTTRLTTEPLSIPAAGVWNKMNWKLPFAPDFNFSNVVGVEFNVENLDSLPTGRMVIDQIELGKNLESPSNVVVQSSPEGINTIEWDHPVTTEAESIIVRAGINNFATKTGEGSVICQVPATGEKGSCQHLNLNGELNYYYTVIAQTAEENQFTDGISQTRSRDTPFIFRNGESAYQIGFNPVHGSIEYMIQNGAFIPYQGDEPLWRVEFFENEELVALNSTQFSTDSDRARFSINGEQNALIYQYRDGLKVLELTVFLQPIDGGTFDFRVLIENQTGLTVRKLVMPQFGFNLEELSEVIIPAYEGVALLPEFFFQERQTYLERPELFGNFVQINARNGSSISVYTIQDNFARSDALANHDPDTPMYQPTNIQLTGSGGRGMIQLEVITEIHSGEVWQSATNRVVYNQRFQDALNRYVFENPFVGVRSFAEKGFGYQTYAKMAHSPILYLDLPSIADGGLAKGVPAWSEVEETILDALPQNGIVQFSNWEHGLGDGQGSTSPQPVGQSIWFDQYGSPDLFVSLLDRINESGRLTMPSVDWTISEAVDVETGELLSPVEIEGRLASTRPEIPVD